MTSIIAYWATNSTFSSTGRWPGYGRKRIAAHLFKVALTTRPAQRAGSDEVYERAEAALAKAAHAAGLEFDMFEGEGAFYGPKQEFHLTDSGARN